MSYRPPVHSPQARTDWSGQGLLEVCVRPLVSVLQTDPEVLIHHRQACLVWVVPDEDRCFRPRALQNPPNSRLIV